jgi:23S rRNA (guanine745-N1)-methyltransferase
VVTLLCTVRNCREPLATGDKALVCARGHSFDRARSGYVNLLQPQDRRSKNPGDTREAVAARRRFLDRGHTEPLTRAIVASIAPGDAMLEIGCGEGHHLAAFRAASTAVAYGVDISAAAIEQAARRYGDCHWVVANADRFLPFADGSFTAVSSITARLLPEESHRVLAAGGVLLVVLPGADDLIELREAILGEGLERDRVERTVAAFAPLFHLEHHRYVSHLAHLDPQAMLDVMSSSYRGLRTREREKLERLDDMDVTLSRDVLVMRSI